MKTGRRRRRVLFIAAAVAGLAWATRHDSSEDIDSKTLGVLYPPLDGQARHLSSDWKIRSIRASSLNVDGAEEILASLIQEFRASDHMPETYAGCAAATASREGHVEPRISGVNHGANGQQLKEKEGKVDELNKGMMPANGIQPSGVPGSLKGSTKEAKSFLDNTDIAEAAAETIETGSGVGDIPPLDTEPGGHSKHGTDSVEKRLEQRVTDKPLPATGDEGIVSFAASDVSIPLDGLNLAEEAPKPVEGGVTVEVGTADVVTTDASDGDAAINDVASDVLGVINTSAGADSHGDTEKALNDGAVDGDLFGVPTCDVPSSETPHINFSVTDGTGDELHTSPGTGDVSEEGAPKAMGDNSGGRQGEADGWIVRQQLGHVQSPADRRCEQSIPRGTDDCFPDSGADFESTPKDIAQVLQKVGAYDGAEFGRVVEEALEQSPAAIHWVAPTSEAGVAKGNLEKGGDEPTQSWSVAAPIASTDEVRALHETPRQPTLENGASMNDARNEEMFPPVTTDTAAPRIMSSRDASVGNEASNVEKEVESALGKHAVPRIHVQPEMSKVGGKAGGVSNSLPRTHFNHFADLTLPSPSHPIKIDGPALRGTSSVLEGPLQETPVVAIGWWSKWGGPSVEVTKGVLWRWAEVADKMGRALAEKILAVIQAWMAKTWRDFIEPHVDRSRRRLEDVARSLFDEVGKHLTDARLAEAL